MGFKWANPPEKAFPELAATYKVNIDAAILALAQRYSAEIEAWMKQNHLWENRTGEAERRLGSEVADLTNKTIIAFGHGVDYGIFLELANGGNYAIVAPALDYFAPKIWADVQRMLK